jgi:succinate dehydrogenase/fumarate reductase-like Fe-S protein
MQHTLNVRAFFFNAKTDYLPYYKNFSMTLNDEDKVEAILAKIKTANEDFAYPGEKLIFKINDLLVTANETVGSVVSKLGTELQVDPALSYRSNHCLIMDDSDFMKKFALLAPYATEEDEAYYKELYTLHYASETFKFSHDYIGDAVLMLAHKMIENGSEHKEAILEAISDQYDGLAACEYENNLFNEVDCSKEIEALNAMVYPPVKKNPLLDNKVIDKMNEMTEKFSKKALYSFEKESIEGVNIAGYAGNSRLLEEIHAKITENGGNVISFSRANKLAGASLLGKQDNLAFLKAATTLLDALDTGAELLVVAKESDLEMFTKNFASIQKRIGREIPLPLISMSDFSALCNTEEVA